MELPAPGEVLGRVNTGVSECESGKDEEGHIRLGEAFSVLQVFVSFWVVFFFPLLTKE